MTKGTLTLGLVLLAFSGCVGEAEGLPSDEAPVYNFAATVAVNPTQLLASQHVSLSLEVTSSSNRAVQADVVLKVISNEKETMYQSRWLDLAFHEHEVWNLTQGFLPDSDAAKKTWVVQIRVTEHATGRVLYDQAVAPLDFKG